MPLAVSWYERRDNADRDAMGSAALRTCRALRGLPTVRDSKFYWTNTDTIAIQTDIENMSDYWDQVQKDAACAAAQFGLSDLTRPVRAEQWADARAGVETFRLAQS